MEILTDIGSALTGDIGKVVVGTLATNLIPIVASAIQKFIYFGSKPNTPGGQAIAQTAAAIVGSLSTYISSIFKGVSPQVAKRAANAVAKSVGDVAKKARQVVDSKPGLSEDQKISEALNIAVSALADIAKQAMQGQSSSVISEVTDDMKDSMNLLSLLPSPLSVEGEQAQTSGSGEIKYGGRSIMRGRRMNADWIFGDTLSGGDVFGPEFFGNQTFSGNQTEDYSQFFGSQQHMEQGFYKKPDDYANTTTTDKATQAATNALSGLASGRSIGQSILWAALPFLVSPALKLVGNIGKKAMSGISYLFPSFTPTQKRIERYFKDPAVQNRINLIGQVAVASADAYYHDQARQQAAQAIYERQKSEVERQNKLIDADNDRKVDQANDDYRDLYLATIAKNKGIKQATDLENQKNKEYNRAADDKYRNDMNQYDTAKKAHEAQEYAKFRNYANSLGPTFDNWYSKLFGVTDVIVEDPLKGADRAIKSIPESERKKLFQEELSKIPESVKELKNKLAKERLEEAEKLYYTNYIDKDRWEKIQKNIEDRAEQEAATTIASHVDASARAKLSDEEYSKFFYQWQKNNLPFAPVFTPYTGTKPTRPEKLSENIEPIFLPLPSHAKHVELKALQPMPMQNSQMFETPYMNQVIQRFSPYIAANLQEYYNAAQNSNNPFSTTDLSNLSSLSDVHVQNPLSTNTFVTSGVTGKSTPLNTVRVPAYMPNSLMTVKPLDFNANQNLFSSAEEAVETLDASKKSKKTKIGKYGEMQGDLPLHMTEQSSLFKDEYKMRNRGYDVDAIQPSSKRMKIERVQPLNFQSNLQRTIPVSTLPSPMSQMSQFFSKGPSSSKGKRFRTKRKNRSFA